MKIKIFRPVPDIRTLCTGRRESLHLYGQLYRLWCIVQNCISDTSSITPAFYLNCKVFQCNRPDIVSAKESSGTHPVQCGHQLLTICTRFVVQPDITGVGNHNNQVFGLCKFNSFLRRYPVLNVQFNSCVQYVSQFYAGLCRVSHRFYYMHTNYIKPPTNQPHYNRYSG